MLCQNALLMCAYIRKTEILSYLKSLVSFENCMTTKSLIPIKIYSSPQIKEQSLAHGSNHKKRNLEHYVERQSGKHDTTKLTSLIGYLKRSGGTILAKFDCWSQYNLLKCVCSQGASGSGQGTGHVCLSHTTYTEIQLVSLHGRKFQSSFNFIQERF